MLQNAKIIKILTHNGLPKHLTKWSRDITYYISDIKVGRSAILYGNTKIIRTSPVTNIEEDENNLILTTENSVYYIKKYGE